MHAATARECSLETYAGDSLILSDGSPSAGAKVFDLFDPSRFDALILYAGAIGQHSDDHALRDFLRRFAPLPVCLISAHLDGYPAVLADNRCGMARLAEHVVQQHGPGPFAWIGGPPRHHESQDRLAGLLDVLGSLPGGTGELWTVDGNYSFDAGKDGIEELLVHRGLRPRHIFCVDDDTALGAIARLESLGIAVPGEIAVSGFDDIGKAAHSLPALTTLTQPWHIIGESAVRQVCDLLEGHKSVLIQSIPADLVIRHSCGCKSWHLPGIESKSRSTESGAISMSTAAMLEASYLHSIESQEDSFTPLLVKLLPGLIAEGLDAEELGSFIMGLHTEGLRNSDNLPYIHALADSAMALLESLVLSGDSPSQETNRDLAALGSFLVDLSNTDDWQDLENVFCRHSRMLGIELLVIVKIADRHQVLEAAELVLAIHHGEPWNFPCTPSLQSRFAVPADLPASLGNGSFILPLTIQHSLFGFCILRISQGKVELSEFLRMHLSTVVQKIALSQSEREDQERQIALDEIQAIARVTRTISHEINTPLGSCITMNSYALDRWRELASRLPASEETGAITAALQSCNETLQRMAGVMAIHHERDYLAENYLAGPVDLERELSDLASAAGLEPPSLRPIRLRSFPDALRHALYLVGFPEEASSPEYSLRQDLRLSGIACPSSGPGSVVTDFSFSLNPDISLDSIGIEDCFNPHLMRTSFFTASWRNRLYVGRNLVRYILWGTLEASIDHHTLKLHLTLPLRLPQGKSK